MKKTVCDICGKDADPAYDIRYGNWQIRIAATISKKKTTDICWSCITNAVLDGSVDKTAAKSQK